MRIVNFGQVVDLEHGGGFAHQFTVILDDGNRISIITNEETVQQLIEIAMMMSSESQERPSHLRVVEPEPAVYPGGDPGELAPYQPIDPGDVADIKIMTQAVMGKVSEEDAPDGVIERGGLGHKRTPRTLIDEDGFMVTPPAKTVPTDSMGYPITGNVKQQPEEEPEEEEVGEQV